MITLEESTKIQRLLNIHRWEATDLYELQDIVRKHIDSSYTACGYCQAQLRHILKRLKNWYLIQPIEGDEPKPLDEEILFEIEPLVSEVDVVEADTVGCQKCKRKRQNKG